MPKCLKQKNNHFNLTISFLKLYYFASLRNSAYIFGMKCMLTSYLFELMLVASSENRETEKLVMVTQKQDKKTRKYKDMYYFKNNL